MTSYFKGYLYKVGSCTKVEISTPVCSSFEIFTGDRWLVSYDFMLFKEALIRNAFGNLT